MAEFLQQCGSWGVLATLAAYAAGVWVNRKTGKALFNPLLMGSIFVIVFLSCFGVPYADYKSSAQPISWLLMPATVSLAIPLYEKWELLEKNLAAIFAAIAAGVLTSLGSVLAMAWVLRIERTHAVSFLPKSVTTAIGMDVAETLGGAAALAGAVIILTGLQGLPYYRPAGQGAGTGHLGPCHRHEQSLTDGRGRRRHERACDCGCGYHDRDTGPGGGELFAVKGR